MTSMVNIISIVVCNGTYPSCCVMTIIIYLKLTFHAVSRSELPLWYHELEKNMCGPITRSLVGLSYS